MIELKNAYRFRFTDTDKKHLHEALLEERWTEVPGCTSISGLFSEDGWKFAWPPKLMAEHLMNWWKGLQGPPMDEDFEGAVKEGKNAWRVKRDRAADTGVAGHLVISNYIQAKINAR